MIRTETKVCILYWNPQDEKNLQYAINHAIDHLPEPHIVHDIQIHQSDHGIESPTTVMIRWSEDVEVYPW